MVSGIETANCVVCTRPITEENKSAEHAMLEAIGGRLEVEGFICRPCNNDTGCTWDAKLASQLLPLALLFGVERQRGSTPGLPIVTTAGEELVINPDGRFTPAKPSFSAEAGPEGIKVQIAARSMKEARRMLAGVKRKYPTLDVDQILANSQMSSSYPKGLVHHRLEFGGEVSGRSIVKSVLSIAHYAGVPTGVCHDALDYLRRPSAPPCFGYYQATDLIVNRPPEVPLNCVGVETSPETGLILGYAEYFGIYRVVACLGRRYAGNRIQACYAVDPRTGTQLDLSIKLDFSEAEIEAIYEYKMLPDDWAQKAFSNVMPAAIKKRFEAEKGRVTERAFSYAWENCGAKVGEILTEEHIWKFSRLAAEILTPFFLHTRRQSRITGAPATKDEPAVTTLSDRTDGEGAATLP